MSIWQTIGCLTQLYNLSKSSYDGADDRSLAMLFAKFKFIQWKNRFTSELVEDEYVDSKVIFVAAILRDL